MKKVMLAEIRWISTSEGGETHFPRELDRYTPIVEFDDMLRNKVHLGVKILYSLR